MKAALHLRKRVSLILALLLLFIVAIASWCLMVALFVVTESLPKTMVLRLALATSEPRVLRHLE